MSESNRRIFRPTKPPVGTLECTQVITSIIHLVIGAVYLNECPRQPYIPIYLLVLGVVSLLLSVFILPCCDRPEISIKIWIFFVCLFAFCWFIAGNVWIYSIYEPNYNKTGSSMDPYYNKTGSSMDPYYNSTGSSMDPYYNSTGSSMDPYYNSTGSSMDSYCNKTLYMFAFWSTNLAYILLGFTIFISCCTYFCTYFCLLAVK